jgi:hypothetical protein
MFAYSHTYRRSGTSTKPHRYSSAISARALWTARPGHFARGLCVGPPINILPPFALATLDLARLHPDGGPGVRVREART